MSGSTGRSGSARPRRRPRRRRSKKLTTVEETSAGGLVVDDSLQWAVLIGRLDRSGKLVWSLPKGHIEEGESAEQTAVREVKEETGIVAQVRSTLGTIDYWFVAERKRIHKTVHHFVLVATGGELSDEDIEVTEVAWVPLTELNDTLIYADERKLVRLALDQFATAEGAGE